MTSAAFDQMSLFQGFTQEQREQLKLLFLRVFVPAGAIIFEQGDPAERLYLVVNGEVFIRFKPDDGPALNVARVRPEGVVGWSAAIGSPAYTSSAVCATDCEMLRISSQDLRLLYDRQPDLGNLLLEKLAAIVAERARHAHPHVVALLHQGLSLPIEKVVETG